jgi:hypothetical protein
MNRFYHSKHHFQNDEDQDEEHKENDFSKSNSNGSSSGGQHYQGSSGNDANSILQIKRELYERSKQLKSALSGMNNQTMPGSVSLNNPLLQREYSGRIHSTSTIIQNSSSSAGAASIA